MGESEVIKKCSCGQEHFVIPGDAGISDLGVFWNCSCKSTLFLPLSFFEITKEAM